MTSTEWMQTIGAGLALAVSLWTGGTWVLNRLFPKVTVKSGGCNPPLIPQNKNYGHSENDASNWIEGKRDRWSFMREQQRNDTFNLYLTQDVHVDNVVVRSKDGRHPIKVELSWEDKDGNWVSIEKKEWQEDRIEFRLLHSVYTLGLQFKIVEPSKEPAWALYAIKIHYKKWPFGKVIKVGEIR